MTIMVMTRITLQCRNRQNVRESLLAENGRSGAGVEPLGRCIKINPAIVINQP
jgi:hypothetical protein